MRTVVRISPLYLRGNGLLQDDLEQAKAGTRRALTSDKLRILRPLGVAIYKHQGRSNSQR